MILISHAPAALPEFALLRGGLQLLLGSNVPSPQILGQLSIGKEIDHQRGHYIIEAVKESLRRPAATAGENADKFLFDRSLGSTNER